MKVKRSSQLAGLAVFALLLFPAAVFAEDPPPERGSVEFGVRYVGVMSMAVRISKPVPVRPESSDSARLRGLRNPIRSSVAASKYEEYRDLRNGFFIERMNATFDNVLNSKNYVSVQSQKTLYRDQSYLATFGQYGKFKVQFRYDEIPHTYTDTARTEFTETAPGVWSFPAAIRSTIQASSAANFPSRLAGTGANAAQGVVTNFNFITPSTLRKAGSGWCPTT